MAKKHGAKQQKRLAKQKAKRLEKRSLLARRSSKDPTIRLEPAEKWPVVEAFMSSELWEEGIGYLVIAQEPEGGLDLRLVPRGCVLPRREGYVLAREPGGISGS